MRAFVPFAYPDSMAEIITYLSQRGKICVDPGTIEELYEEFSDERGAQWLHADEETLADFSEWLENKEV